MTLIELRELNVRILQAKGELDLAYTEGYGFSNYAYLYPSRAEQSLETESYYDEDENLWLIGKDRWITADGYILEGIPENRNYFKDELKHIGHL